MYNICIRISDYTLKLLTETKNKLKAESSDPMISARKAYEWGNVCIGQQSIARKGLTGSVKGSKKIIDWLVLVLLCQYI